MDEIIRLNNVQDYNDRMEVETLNPLVSVVNFEEGKNKPCEKPTRFSYGFYTIFLKDALCGEMTYGRSHYDYQEGTLVFIAPHQVYGINPHPASFIPKGYALVFHPDLLRGTPLAHNIGKYDFFSYKVNEALHLSKHEREMILECLKNIQTELNHAIDKHSKTLIVSNIELLLNYCVRYYDRQFITRANANKDIIARFEDMINKYFNSDQPQIAGLPSVSFCAEQLHLSPNYFGDLIKKEIGTTAQDYIQQRIIDMAKDKIMDEELSVSEIAYELGFKYPQHFTRLFKKRTGYTPNEYKRAN